MASLFLKEVATGCAERRPSLQVLHKLCIESSQYEAYKVFKTANVTNIPEQQTVSLYKLFTHYGRKCVKEKRAQIG